MKEEILLRDMQALRNKRLSKGFTQQRIAEESGISERGYRYIESGRKTPRVDTAREIARNLDDTIERLFPPMGGAGT